MVPHLGVYRSIFKFPGLQRVSLLTKYQCIYTNSQKLINSCFKSKFINYNETLGVFKWRVCLPVYVVTLGASILDSSSSWRQPFRNSSSVR